jgi:hypothetical protein
VRPNLIRHPASPVGINDQNCPGRGRPTARGTAAARPRRRRHSAAAAAAASGRAARRWPPGAQQQRRCGCGCKRTGALQRPQGVVTMQSAAAILCTRMCVCIRGHAPAGPRLCCCCLLCADFNPSTSRATCISARAQPRLTCMRCGRLCGPLRPQRAPPRAPRPPRAPPSLPPAHTHHAKGPPLRQASCVIYKITHEGTPAGPSSGHQCCGMWPGSVARFPNRSFKWPLELLISR